MKLKTIGQQSGLADLHLNVWQQQRQPAHVDDVVRRPPRAFVVASHTRRYPERQITALETTLLRGGVLSLQQGICQHEPYILYGLKIAGMTELGDYFAF